MIDRRGFALGTCAAFVGLALPEAAGATSETLDFARIEAECGGRLGVAVLDTRNGRRMGHRADERFPMCSTFKLLAGAAVLARARCRQGAARPAHPLRREGPRHLFAGHREARRRRHDARRAVRRRDHGERQHGGQSPARALGGPEGLTAFARSLGDSVTRLDRIEPELNEAMPGDPRDTTTPAAMARTSARSCSAMRCRRNRASS